MRPGIRQGRRSGWVMAAGIALCLSLPSCSTGGRTLPLANITTPNSPARGLIEIRTTLRDRSSTRVNLDFQWRPSTADLWRPITEGPGGEGTIGLAASPGGINHIFIWDSLADLGPRLSLTTQVHVSPHRQGKRGTGSSTALFEVNNTGVFVPAGGAPLEFRDRHTATRLPGGRVLIAGGVDAQGAPLARAEVFDPWVDPTVIPPYSPTSIPLLQAREGHTAVALADGRVLIIGGRDGAGIRNDAQPRVGRRLAHGPRDVAVFPVERACDDRNRHR